MADPAATMTTGSENAVIIKIEPVSELRKRWKRVVFDSERNMGRILKSMEATPNDAQAVPSL